MKRKPGAIMQGAKIFRPAWPVHPLRWRSGPVPPGTSFGRINSLEVRLARNPGEVRAAQKLRYHVFYEEMSATPKTTARFGKRDADLFDAVCDHLLVLDHDVEDPGKLKRWKRHPRIVGTYRLLRQEVAELGSGFYTQGEFDLAPLVARHRQDRFLELGRSCVLKPYRTKRTLELLWQGIMAYVRAHDLSVMIGCASLAGTDPKELALPLSFLHHHARAPMPWRARAHPSRYVEMNMMAKEDINTREALRALPPLIKGYMRAGCYIGDGAVVDYQFGTTDVLIIFPVSSIEKRYAAHFDPNSELAAAS